MNQIDLHEILTPQEHYLIGGTPPHELFTKDSDFYKPFGLLTGNFTAEQISQKRNEIKTFSGIATYTILKDAKLALKLEDLDPISGLTLKDPEVVEVSKDEISVKPDLTKKFYSDYEASYKASGGVFEGRLRDYPTQTSTENKG